MIWRQKAIFEEDSEPTDATNSTSGTASQAECPAHHAGLSGEFFSALLGELFLSFLVGALWHVFLKRAMQITGVRSRAYVRDNYPYLYREVWLPYLRGHVDIARGVLVLGLGYLIFVLAWVFDTQAEMILETLLTCMTATFLLINLPTDDGIDYRHRLHGTLMSIADPV